ncbi:MAG: type II toxin-antitoxin system VapC family toxin [Candidatus Competibacteraceae bacterium]
MTTLKAAIADADATDRHYIMLVDTNILAYLLIVGDRTQAAQTLFAHDAEWKSEAFVLVEFSNILATYQRLGELSHAQAEYLLNEAEIRLQGLVSLPHITALRTAQRFRVSAYDARFLATAENLGARLVTEDTKLRTAAPKLTQSLAEALAAA